MNSKDILNSEIKKSDSSKTKNHLFNINSYYFLQKLFVNIPQKKGLELIKINKNIKNRLNIDINNYKEYCELYTSIEIEIIPLQNKFDEFINIPHEERKYYHVYFK